MKSILIALVLTFALVAHAEDATVLSERSVLERFVMKYWGNYSGPQISSFSSYTTDTTAATNRTPQNFDDLLTLGYQVTPDFRPGIGMPFNLILTINPAIQIKPLYFGIIDVTLVHNDNFSIHSDFRIYTPLGDVARNQDVVTGFRSSQVTLYNVPGSKLLLGCYTYIRTWVYGTNGSGYRNDFELYLSPFARYPLSKTLSATLWSDWLQLSHQFGTPSGLKNLPIDIQPGIRWDITSNINVNPYINIIPANLTWEALNLGMVINARLL